MASNHKNNSYKVSFHFKQCNRLIHPYHDYKLEIGKQVETQYKKGKNTDNREYTNSECMLERTHHHMKYKLHFRDRDDIEKNIPFMRIFMPAQSSFTDGSYRFVLSQIQCITRKDTPVYTSVYGDDTLYRIHITFIVFKVHIKHNKKTYTPTDYVTYQFRLDGTNYQKVKTGFIDRLASELSEYDNRIPTQFEIEWIRHCESCANVYRRTYLPRKLLSGQAAAPPCTKKGVSQSLMKSLFLQNKYNKQKPRLYGCSPTIRGIETAFYAFQHIPDDKQVYLLPYIHETMNRFDTAFSGKVTPNKPLSTGYLMDYKNELHKLFHKPDFYFDFFSKLIDNIQENIIPNNFMLFWKRVLLPLYKQDESLSQNLTLVTHSLFMKSIFDIPAVEKLFPENLSSYIADYNAVLYQFTCNSGDKFDIQSNYVQFGCPLIIYTTLKEKINVGDVSPRMLC